MLYKCKPGVARFNSLRAHSGEWMAFSYSGLKDEYILILGILFISAFIYLSVSKDVGNIFTILTAGYGFIVLFSKRPFQFIREFNSESVKYILFSFAIWCVISLCLAKFFFPDDAVTDLVSLFRTIYLHADIPILIDVKIVVQFIWGIMFPVVESIGLLCLAMVIISPFVKVDLHGGFSLKQSNHWYFVILVGLACMGMHIVTRQGSGVALLSDFIFFSLSAVISLKRKQLAEAFGLHGLVNNIVLLVGGGA
jgi:hypothetical protein